MFLRLGGRALETEDLWMTRRFLQAVRHLASVVGMEDCLLWIQGVLRILQQRVGDQGGVRQGWLRKG